VTDKSLRATLAPPLTGHTRLNLGICDEIDSLTKQGLAEVVAPLTRLTTLLPPTREIFSTESDEDSFDINNYGDWVRRYGYDVCEEYDSWRDSDTSGRYR
jgi:hypothetical protein